MKKKFSEEENAPEAKAIDEDADEIDADGKTSDEDADGDDEGKLVCDEDEDGEVNDAMFPCFEVSTIQSDFKFSLLVRIRTVNSLIGHSLVFQVDKLITDSVEEILANKSLDLGEIGDVPRVLPMTGGDGSDLPTELWAVM